MLSMKKKYEEGKLYKIRFYDHCIGSHDKMVCEVVGWIVEDFSDHVVLTCWRVDTEDIQVKRDNVEPVSILKGVILTSRKYS